MCAGDSRDGNDDDTDNENAQKKLNAWDGLKVWFANRDAPTSTSDAELDEPSAQAPVPPTEQSTEPPPRTGPRPHVTIIPDVQSDAQRRDSDNVGDSVKGKDDFRWPWQRDPKNGKVRTPVSPDAKISSQNGKSRVTHSDTKPGGMLDVENLPIQKKEKENVFQEKLKQVVDTIVTKVGKNTPEATKDTRPKTEQDSDEKTQRPTKNDADTSEKKIGSPRRLRGIMELYMPPADSDKEESQSSGASGGWFGIPWKRQDPETAESQPDASSSMPQSSSEGAPNPVKDSQVSENQFPNSQSANNTNSTELEKKKKPWFTPPWAEKGADDSPTNVSESVETTTSPGISQSVKEVTLPEEAEERNVNKEDMSQANDLRQAEKKSWFRWPGSKESKEEISVTAENGDDVSSKNGTPEDSSTEQVKVKAIGTIVELPRKDDKQENDESSEREQEDVDRDSILVLNESKAIQPPNKGPPTDVVSIPQRDVAAIRLIFGSETFFATEALSAPGGLIFRGNLRGEPKATLAKLEERLASRLGDKYTLCLAEGEEDLRPVVVVVPTARDRRPSTPRQKVMAVVVGMMTVSTCLGRGLAANMLRQRILVGYGPPPLNNLVDRLFQLPVPSSLTIAVAITVVLVASQVVQRAVAARHGTRIAIPYVLPSYQLGSFGAVVQLASPTPTRATLFDIAMSGAVMLVIPSLICLIIGLRLSTSFTGVFPVPMSMVSNSILMGFLTKQVPSGRILVDYGRSLIGLHPLAVIGANCLTIAAFNLLPIRQLDGGRIISALYGRKTAVHASRVTMLFLLLATSKNPSLIVFLLAIMLGPWHVDRPAKNELTEPDGLRTIVGYLMMLLMIGILLPYPRSSFFGTL